MSAAAAAPYRILMVCMGNICRSPTAEAVLRQKLQLAGLSGLVEVASAGTHASWHAGNAPDPRSMRHAGLRGYDLSQLRAKAVRPDDGAKYDLILAMDSDNLEVLKESIPSEYHQKLMGLCTFVVPSKPHSEVPDPYQGGPDGFELVLDLVEDACNGLVAHLAGLLKSTASKP